jgi:type II secretory ATPase GspE/PulE/Tfp pilus assembly ATPase PilB-like protein
MKVTSNFNQNTLDNAISKDHLIVDAKRESKLLHRSKKKIDPNSSLMICQNIIAIQKGYKDWFDLYHSVKKKIQNNLASQLLHQPLTILEKVFHSAFVEKVSDIHLEMNKDNIKVRFRIYGELSIYKTFAKQELISDMVRVFNDLNLENIYDFNYGTSQYIFDNQLVQYTIQTAPVADGGMHAVIKVHYPHKSEHSRLERLGYLPSQVKLLNKLIDKPSGAILIAGTTGSGKTTSVHALCDRYKAISNRIVYSVNSLQMKSDDFIEIEIPNNNYQEQLLKYMDNMHSEPSMITIEEIRNKNDGNIINKAYNVGIKFISTLHASGAVGIIDRLADLNLSYQHSAQKNMISGLIYQKLMPCVCQHCSISLKSNIKYLGENNTNNQWIDLWKELKALLPNNHLNFVKVRNKNGCNQCKFGINGRIVVAEIIEINDELRKQINNGDSKFVLEAWRNTSDGDISSGDHNGKTIDENCLYQVLKGIISLDDFHRYFRLSQIKNVN